MEDFSMNILITGASRGLGFCLVKKFLDSGHRVFAGVSSPDNIRELEAVRDNENLSIFKLNVAEPKDIENAGKLVNEQADSIDAVINSAGVLLNRNGYITEDTYENLLKTFKVNTIGPIYLNNVFLPLLKKSKNPAVINISSEIMAIDHVGSWFPAYCLSKTAIAQYSFSLKETFNELNINARVFAVHPGRMKTAMGGDNGQISPEESAGYIYKIAVGQILPGNEEIYVNYKGEPMLNK